MNQKIKSFLLRSLPPTLFLASLAAVSFFHYKTQGLWDVIDQEKDQVAKKVRQSLITHLQSDCMAILPNLANKNTAITLGEFAIPSTISYQGYFVDFLPFEQVEDKGSALIVRYHFNVKERMQYSNWYLGVVELSVKRKNNQVISCQMTKEISGGEADFYPSAPK